MTFDLLTLCQGFDCRPTVEVHRGALWHASSRCPIRPLEYTFVYLSAQMKYQSSDAGLEIPTLNYCIYRVIDL